MNALEAYNLGILKKGRIIKLTYHDSYAILSIDSDKIVETTFGAVTVLETGGEWRYICKQAYGAWALSASYTIDFLDTLFELKIIVPITNSLY